MSLVRLSNVSLAYGHHPLLHKSNLVIEPGERVCLIGRNGTGKSSLMKVIDGEIQADDGEVWVDAGIRISRLKQDVPLNEERSVFDVVADGLGDLADVIKDYHDVTQRLATDYSESLLDHMARLQQKLEAKDGWRMQQQIETIMTTLELPAEKNVCELSGGWRRRVLLAQALVGSPDLLLLDEPTNHLDIEAIKWLENFLLSQNISLLFITHDRALLKKLATRIIELDRGNLTSWPGDYENYLVKKEEFLAIEAEHAALFDKRLAQEEVWIRQGIKARRTRNEGRVRRLEALRETRSGRRETIGNVALSVASSEKSGKLVFSADDISFAYGKNTLLNHFSVEVVRGDRIGLIGPNGVGKSTLLNLLQGKLQPDSGTVRQGTQMNLAYFDQQREQLDKTKSVVQNVSEGSDTVTIQGRSRHVVGYLKDFLFDPERLHSPASTLSGGECNRLMLAKLFTKPANVLVLDEPTNDLDIETLEMLESLLVEYAGTIILVSHDREFLDNVVTSTLVFDGTGNIHEYVGGYQDYLRQTNHQAGEQKTLKQKSGLDPNQRTSTEKPESNNTAKLSYQDKQELDALPAKIERLEQQQQALHVTSSAADFHESSNSLEIYKKLETVERELALAYERWDELESRP